MKIFCWSHLSTAEEDTHFIMVLIHAVFTVVVIPLVAVLLSYSQIQQLVHRAEGFAAKTVCSAVFLSNRYVYSASSVHIWILYI